MYSDFINQVYTNVKEHFAGEDVRVDLGDAKAVGKTGATLTVSQGCVGAVFYLDGWENDSTAEEAAKEIIKRSQLTDETEHRLKDVMEHLTDVGYVKEHVIPVLLNTSRNQSNLDGVVKREFFDLTVIYKVEMQCFMQGASVCVRDELLKSLELSEEELWKYARRNCSYECISIMDAIHEFAPSTYVPDDISMQVLRMKSFVGGAMAMLDDKTLQKVAKKENSNLIIIPSSVNEIITIPSDVEMSLDGMIKGVNDSCVEPDDVLSHHSYFYTRESHTLSCRGFEPINLTEI